MSSWNMQWDGRATDYVPDLLTTVGKPGRLAKACQDAIWESVQGLGEQNPHAYVRVRANGWEEPGEVGLGGFNLSVQAIPEPGEIQEKLKEQQPVDLLNSQGDAVTPVASESQPAPHED